MLPHRHQHDDDDDHDDDVGGGGEDDDDDDDVAGDTTLVQCCCPLIFLFCLRFSFGCSSFIPIPSGGKLFSRQQNAFFVRRLQTMRQTAGGKGGGKRVSQAVVWFGVAWWVVGGVWCMVCLPA